MEVSSKFFSVCVWGGNLCLTIYGWFSYHGVVHRVLRILPLTRFIALGVKDTTPHSDAAFLGDPSNDSA